MSSNGSEVELTSPPLLVSTLEIRTKSHSRGIEKIIIKAGTIKTEISRVVPPGGGHQERFEPPLEILLHTQILVFIHPRGSSGDVAPMSLDPKTVLREANENDKKLYCKTEGDIEVSLDIQSLSPSANRALGSCSRFRILIIGESGVGKSSLIDKVFGVAGAGIDDISRGQANVHQEHISLRNSGFVIHDSCGFESGDHRNLDAACDFISDRRKMQDLQDQLHAIWLCLEIPFAGARLVEAGVEKFLKKKQEVLGDIPLIVVFTKLDLLENMLRAEALEENKILDDSTLKRLKDNSFHRSCFVPVRTMTKNEGFSYVVVSTTEGYEGSLNVLVEDTARIIHRYFRSIDVHHVTTATRRAKSH